MNNDIEDDGTVKATVTSIKKPKVVVGHIAPIQAKDIRLEGYKGTLINKDKPALEQTPQQHYEKVKADFLYELEALIEANPVFNTHRIPAKIIAHHMTESAHLFNATLFLHNTAVTMQSKKDE